MQVLLGSTFKDANDETLMETREEYFQMGDQPMVRQTKTDKPTTLRDVIKRALIRLTPAERQIPPSYEIQEKRGDLREKVRLAEDPCDLSTEEIMMIKPLIANLGDVLVTRQSCKLLEGKPIV
jgi:hypothetical protein